MSLHPSSLRIVLLGTVTLAAASSLTAQDLPSPQNPDALLRELDQVTKNSETHEQQRRGETISRIQSAAASPAASVEFYLQALDGTRYLDKHQDFSTGNRKIRTPSGMHHSRMRPNFSCAISCSASSVRKA